MRLVWLSLGFSPACSCSCGDHRLEDEAVALLSRRLLDLVAHLAQLGLAARLDLVRYAGSWLAMIQLVALLLGLGQPGQCAGRDDVGRQSGRRRSRGRAPARPASTVPCSST